ncbi:MAG: hypothetical protein WKF84_02945 [Pyrinomonadaceae bacterium]
MSQFSYEQLMGEMPVAKNVRADIDPSWNSLEHFEEEETALLHYTDMHTQPWVSTANPLESLWMKDFFEAIDMNYISIEMIKDHVKLGYVRPSLLEQVEHRFPDSRFIADDVRRLMDHLFYDYVRPLNNQTPSLLSSAKKLFYSVLMSFYLQNNNTKRYTHAVLRRAYQRSLM